MNGYFDVEIESRRITCLTLATIAFYKFSNLISIHFLKKLVECLIVDQSILVRSAKCARTEPHSWENLVIYLLVNTRPYVSPSAPQGNQCEMLHFLASEGACNLILHIHVVVNWQLLKQGIRWLVLLDRFAGSGVDPSSLRAFEVIRWQAGSFQGIAGSTLRGFFWKGNKFILRKKL